MSFASISFRAEMNRQMRRLEQTTDQVMQHALNAPENPHETMCATFFDAMRQSALEATRGDEDTIHDCDNVLTRIRRRAYIPRFGFPVVSADDIGWIAAETGGSPMFEVGAAPGYLAWECHRFGLEVRPSDPDPQGTNGWDWTSPKKILRCSGQQAVRVHRGKNMLWSWPDYREAYTAEVLRRFAAESDGEFIVYIGEGPGGCTGSDEFHEILERDFTLAGERDIRQFPFINDRIYVHQRNSRG